MSAQADHWSRSAGSYEKEFVDPYLPEVRSPLKKALQRLAGPGRIAADLGCGIGLLLPFLAQRFHTVHALDFAQGMLDRAREQAAEFTNLQFHQRSFLDLKPLHGQIHVAVAVNSLVLPDVADLDASLREIHACLRPNGAFLGIVPGIDGVHYYTMLLVERALAQGKPIAAARKNAAFLGELNYYDFAFGQFNYRGLEQHFWQPFEVKHRFAKAGFKLCRLKKVHLAWKQFACAQDLQGFPPPWDWFFHAERA